ncbi:MAG: Uma2 family endonuclease [Aphanocapsa sp. GSE-SYN-MK-11-07L]|jgi:Uma2 family endonuclease|nr:Uma2 family endonuclease [Aphanocapsa sp. GSE-SYN-MK-11-07L]
MAVSRPLAEQIDSLGSVNLLTMYDLPSEDPEELGLPDEFHDLQPQLLSATLRLTAVSSDRIFTGTDLNLYYDAQHPLWHKRPDWFVAIGVPRLYAERDLRLSYVVWDEGVNPFVVVELLSPGTEKEDLGQTESEAGEPPTKWEVYERILNVPYYILYDRYNGMLRGFHLIDGRYQEMALEDNRLWLQDLKLGLGLWQGKYEEITRQWLRWLDLEDNWIATPLEQSEQQRAEERQQRLVAEQERDLAQAKAARMAERLKALGINPDEV